MTEKRHDTLRASRQLQIFDPEGAQRLADVITAAEPSMKGRPEKVRCPDCGVRALAKVWSTRTGVVYQARMRLSDRINAPSRGVWVYQGRRVEGPFDVAGDHWCWYPMIAPWPDGLLQPEWQLARCDTHGIRWLSIGSLVALGRKR